jgi:molybdopterin synthase catalytic subunit
LIRAHFGISFEADATSDNPESSEHPEAMANPVCDVLVTNEMLATRPVDVDLACGAVVDFHGVVRRAEGDRDIVGIDYEAHKAMAEHQMKQIANEAAEKFGVAFIALHHRSGFVAAGETSLWLRVTCPHRAAAFDASKWIVDELKKRVPIWKRPHYKIDIDASRNSTVVAEALAK